MTFSTTMLKAANFKCFGTSFQGFERIKPINIIIGRNNSGKSTLIDLVAKAVTDANYSDHGHKRSVPEFQTSFLLDSATIERFIEKERVELQSPDGRVRWQIPQQDWAMARLSGKLTTWKLAKGRDMEFIAAEYDKGTDEQYDTAVVSYIGRRLQNKVKNPFSGHHFCRVAAERDVVPEKPLGQLRLSANGTGLTSVIAQYIHSDILERNLVEVDLLTELNAIFRPDAQYKRLLVQQNGSGVWEIFLEEENKGRIRLSQTGSGLKTVLLVLANLILVPQFEGEVKPLKDCFFAFEEIENNLHPAVQRRLFSYLRRRAVEEHSHIFVTTHSNVVIDLFSRDEQAQIIHVTHDGTSSTVTTVETSAHSGHVLDDLDVRASDLLQTNVVVWVEGPSDMIYFNTWIRLWTDGAIKEGIHYQCVPYGGSVNAHLSFEEPEDVEDMIQALNINRHAVLLIDSDRRAEDSPLKKHAERLTNEVVKVGGIAWVTCGREVENYIPAAALRMVVECGDVPAPGQFDDVLVYCAKCRGVQETKKTVLARQVKEVVTRDMLESALDLGQKLEQVIDQIKKWNRIDQ